MLAANLKLKKKTKLYFPIGYYSNNSLLIRRFFKHLASFICAWLILDRFKILR